MLGLRGCGSVWLCTCSSEPCWVFVLLTTRRPWPTKAGWPEGRAEAQFQQHGWALCLLWSWQRCSTLLRGAFNLKNSQQKQLYWETLFYYFIYGMNNCLMVICELHIQFFFENKVLLSYSVFSHCSFVLKACMYPATLRSSVRVNLKTSNGSKICQVTLRNLPWDEWVGKISLICSWEEIPFRYNFIFCERSAWDCGCSVPQRQV